MNKVTHRNLRRPVGTAIVLFLGLFARPVASAERIITIGDSWAHLAANYGSIQLMLDTFFPGQGYTVANESFGGGTAAQHASWLDQITTKINAHPTADIVWLSTGGNDMLLGQLYGGWYLGMPGEAGFFDTIGANVQIVVNHILSLRSDLQVVIISYDYPNLWDFDLSNGGNAQLLRANYALGLSGTGWISYPYPPTFEIGQQQSVNAAFRNMEQRKANIGATSRRVHHVSNYGLVNFVAGYNGWFGTWPAGVLYNDLPVTKGKLGSGGTDPIHLNTDGYNTVALHAYNNFFNTAFQPAVLSLSTNTINFGNVRIGTIANGSVTAGNSGPNFTKVKNLSFPAAGGEFGGGAQGFAPLFKDPTLGSDTANKGYTYAPTNHGQDSQGLTVTSDSGNPGLTLTGTGVGPEFAGSAPSLDFGGVEIGGTVERDLTVSNNTPDANLGQLTHLTLISAQITGPDAGLFTLLGFTPGTVLGKNQSANLSVRFAASAPPGPKSATLTFLTDQGAAFGTSGQSFGIPLTGTGVPYYDLVITYTNGSWGTVDLDPDPSNPNTPRYPAGTIVTLTAQPIQGKSFRQWEVFDPNHPDDANYAAVDPNISIQVVMNHDTQVNAVFRCGSALEGALLMGGLFLLVARIVRQRRVSMA